MAYSTSSTRTHSPLVYPREMKNPQKIYLREGLIRRKHSLLVGRRQQDDEDTAKAELEAAESMWNLITEPSTCTVEKLVDIQRKYPNCQPERILHHSIESNGHGRGREALISFNLYEPNPDSNPFAFHNHELPLHRACSNGCSLEVIRFLVDAFPLSACIPASGKILPLHAACGRYHSVMVDAEDGTNNNNNRHHHDLEVLRYLIQVYPEALELEDKNGCLPLHHVIQRTGGACHPDVVRLLVESNPNALHKQRHCLHGIAPSMTPLDLARRRRRRRTSYGSGECTSTATEVVEYLESVKSELDVIYVKLHLDPAARIKEEEIIRACGQFNRQVSSTY